MKKIQNSLAFCFILATVFFSIHCEQKASKPKYIFLFIGDGMGISQVTATNVYLRTLGLDSLIFTSFPTQATVSTRCVDSYITDSGAAGTALACGEKTNTAVIGMNYKKDKKLVSIARKAKNQGFKIGIVTTVSLDHATPSAFYAHQPERANYYDIAVELAQSNFDYFAGGSFLKPNGKDNTQPSIYELIKKNGYRLINSEKDFRQLKSSNAKIVITSPLLAEEESIPYSIDKQDSTFNLKEYTRKGIELLDNEKGFFMMVEGGKIDWACHANDGATVIQEVIAFNAAIAEAVAFYKKHPDETLIIVTADHETGGMSLGYITTKYKVYLDKLKNQKVSIDVFSKIISDTLKYLNPNNLRLLDIMPLITQNFGLAYENNSKTVGENTNVLNKREISMLEEALQKSIGYVQTKVKDESILIQYGNENPLSITLMHIMDSKAGIGWTTYSHTGSPVGCYALGVGNEMFSGFYENNLIPLKICKLTAW